MHNVYKWGVNWLEVKLETDSQFINEIEFKLETLSQFINGIVP
jgi:hypothetical protein